jgi:hypothetical protein
MKISMNAVQRRLLERATVDELVTELERRGEAFLLHRLHKYVLAVMAGVEKRPYRDTLGDYRRAT